MELKITTQKSRLSEMEGALSLSQENANKVRQKSLQVWSLKRLTHLAVLCSKLYLTILDCSNGIHKVKPRF